MAQVSTKQKLKGLYADVKKSARAIVQPRVMKSPVPESVMNQGKLFTAPSMSNLRGNVARVRQMYGQPWMAKQLVKDFGNVTSGRSGFLGGAGAQAYLPQSVRPLFDTAGGVAESIARGPADIAVGAIGGRPRQAVSGAVRTGMTLLGAKKFTPVFAAAGGSLGALASKLQGESAAKGFGLGIGEAVNVRGLTRYTDPYTLGTSGVAKSLFRSPIAQQVAGRTVSGLANTAEDYILSKMAGVTPRLRDHLLSFGLGALISSGGTKADWNNLKRMATRGLRGADKRQAEEIINIARGGFRSSRSGRFVEAPYEKVTFIGGREGYLPKSQRRLLRTQFIVDKTKAPTVKKSYLKRDIASGLLGSAAGIDMDEEGGLTYDFGRGALGAAGGVLASRQLTGRPTRFGLSIEPVQGTVPPGRKERGFIRNVKGSPLTAPEVAAGLTGKATTYEPITNKATIENAKFNLDTLGWDESKRIVSESPLTADTGVLGQQLIRRAQDEGRFDEAIDVTESLAKKATSAGQAVQAFSIWGKLTPEGMLRYAVNQVDKAEQQMGFATKTARKLFGKESPKLTPDDARIITDLMKKAQTAPTEREQAEYARAALEHIGRKIPWGVSDVIDEYRYNNMLSGPLTHLRNLYSNVLQSTVVRPATLVAEGRVGDAAKYEAAALKAIPESFGKAVDAFKSGKRSERIDDLLQGGAAQFKPKRLGKLYNIPSSALEASDVFFSNIIRQGELARGASTEEAEKAAQYWVFRQGLNETQQGNLLNYIDNMTKGIYGLRKYGMGWVIPFLQTPMNVAKQGIEFSPAGALTAMGAKNKREQLAKAGLGSIAALVGASLAMEGRTTWDVPTDPTQKELFYAAGKKPYSIKIGDNWVPMQYLGPFAWSVGLPAAYRHYQENSRTALTDSQVQKLISAAASGAKFWSQQTFVQGLGQFVKLAEGDADYDMPRVIANFASQLNPMTSLQRYVAQVVDPVFRKPRGDTFVGKVRQQLQAGIPGQSKKLEAYTNPLGEESKRNISGYVAPWALGREDARFTNALNMRGKELQANNFANKIESSYRREVEDISTQIAKEVEGALFSQADLSDEQKIEVSERVRSKVQSKVKKKIIARRADEIAEKIKSQWGDTPEQRRVFLTSMKNKGLLTPEVISALARL